MPPGKSKEDTWKTADLERHMKDGKGERRRPRDDKDREHRKKDRHREDGKDRHRDDDDRKHRSKRDDDHGERKERRDKDRKHRDDDRHKDRERDRDRDRDRHDRDKDKDKHRSSKHRDETEDERRRRKREERRRREEEEGEGGSREHRRHRDHDDDDRERRHRKHRDDDDEGKKDRRKHDDDGRSHRKPRDEDDRERRHRKHREEDKDERRHRRGKDEDDDREQRHRRHRDEEEGKQRKHRDEEKKESSSKSHTRQKKPDPVESEFDLPRNYSTPTIFRETREKEPVLPDSPSGEQLITARHETNYLDNMLDSRVSDLAVTSILLPEPDVVERSKSEAPIRDIFSPDFGRGLRCQSAETPGSSSMTLADAVSGMSVNFKRSLHSPEETAAMDVNNRVTSFELPEDIAAMEVSFLRPSHSSEESIATDIGVEACEDQKQLDVPEVHCSGSNETRQLMKRDSEIVYSSGEQHPASTDEKTDPMAETSPKHVPLTRKESRKTIDPPSGSRNRATERERRASISRNMAMQSSTAAQKQKSPSVSKGQGSSQRSSQGQRSSTSDRGAKLQHKIVSSGTTNAPGRSADTRSIEALKTRSRTRRESGAAAPPHGTRQRKPESQKPTGRTAAQRESPPVPTPKTKQNARKSIDGGKLGQRNSVTAPQSRIAWSGKGPKTRIARTGQEPRKATPAPGHLPQRQRTTSPPRRTRGNVRKTSSRELARSMEGHDRKTSKRPRHRKPPNSDAAAVNGIMKSPSENSLGPAEYEALCLREDFETYTDDSVVEEDYGQQNGVKKEDNEDDYNYEDDFEDYEDDFEDDDGDNDEDDDDNEEDDDDSSSRQSRKSTPGEVSEIMQAMNEENDRLLKPRTNRSHWDDEPEDDPRQRDQPSVDRGRTFINFVSAKQRAITEQTSSKTKRRGQELLKLIELDKASYEIFDMPPIDEYELYMMSFGRSDNRQAYVQTNEDNLDREIQTEEIETTEKWTQHPPEDIYASGGPDGAEQDTNHEHKPVDTVKLNKFMEDAGQVFLILLEEGASSHAQRDVRHQQSSICVSEAFVELSHPPFLKGRHITSSHFSESQPHMLITVYSPGRSSSASLRGVTCVWNVNEPSWPHKVLVSESQPRCCCFSPVKANLVFAGMHDGSVVVWDLRESGSLHRVHRDAGTEWVLRHPTYDTAGVLKYENHHSAIIAVSPIIAQGDAASGSTAVAGLGGAADGEGMNFQLATLEENSTVHLWVVAQINSPDLAGSESDLGLAPGGRVKLIRSSSIQLESPLREGRMRTTVRAFDMRLLPSNNSHFYVATDTGCVLHGVRYGGKAPPRAYRPEIENLMEVTSIDFCPFPEPVFLAGCADGSLRLYSIQSEMPVVTWPDATEGSAIKLVRWCRSRPSVFFVLDDRSCLFIWDLLMDDAVAVKREQISEHRVTSLDVSNDYSATGLGVPGRKPQMIVCLENGSAEIHTISKQFSALLAEEVDRFSAYLQQNL